MKIALTSDIHLSTLTNTPKRYEVLEYILKDISAQNIDTIIIAGDIFDESANNYSDFENICKKYQNIKFHILCGNHDSSIEQKFFTLPNIIIYNNTPSILTFDNLMLFLIPYRANTTMSEILEEYCPKNFKNPFIIISHGDYIDLNKEINPYEPGIYMPITKKDIQKFNPYKVILGHIHKALNLDKIIYIGSPYPLDASEIGKKRYLILDTKNLSISSIPISNDVIYIKCTLITFPYENEKELLKTQLIKKLEKMQISSQEWNKIKLTLNLKGYTLNKNSITHIIEQILKDLNITLDNLNLDDLSVSLNSQEFLDIVRQTFKEIDNTLSLNPELNLEKEDIISFALKIIFGEKL